MSGIVSTIFWKAANVLFLGSVLAVNEAAALGQTPGSYTNYRWPSGTVLDSVDFTITVTVDPGYTASTYWSNEFNFAGNEGYTGFQSNGGEPRLFLFSIWGATEARSGSPGSRCIDFEEGGTGKSCRMHYDWKAGHMLRFHLAREKGQWFGVTVTDMTANVSFKLGSIRAPSAHLSTEGMSTWTEYFEWNDDTATCTNQPFSQVRIGLPNGNGGGVTARVASTEKSKTCTQYTRNEIVPNGTIQTNAIGNSLRGPITSEDGGCIDAEGGADSGTSAITYECNGQQNQAWVLGADHALQLAANLCLDVGGHARKLGSRVIVYDCNKGLNQQWIYDGSALKSRISGLCLTAHEPGSQLTVDACKSGANQSWKIALPPTSAPLSRR
jgi:hypothetical protein